MHNYYNVFQIQSLVEEKTTADISIGFASSKLSSAIMFGV